MIWFLYIFSARVISKRINTVLYSNSFSALISREHIRKFDSEHWKLFRNKSSAPKFKSALAEARKKAKESISISPKTSGTLFAKLMVIIGLDKLDTSVKKRGRPRKLKLIESREKLQKLLYSKDAKCTNEIVDVLTRINNANDLDRDECDSSKIGNLLKKVFCSDDYKLWHNNIEILKLVQGIAIKIINSK